MTIDEKLRLTIGELIIQAIVLQDKVEALTKENEELKAKSSD